MGRDPDIGEGAALAWSDAPGNERGPLASWLARWQAPLFFPLMLLRSGGMHVLGIKRLLRRRDRASAVEASLIMVHAALYLTVVLWVLSPLKALAFVVVQQAVFSLYLGISFAPNHKGMPIIESATAAGFARRQVVTARNIRGDRFTTFMLGGLNYQIEHHLFPSMPRPNLRRVQGLVRDFCAATDLGYSEESFVESFRQIVHHLRCATLEQAPAAVLTDYCDLTGKTEVLNARQESPSVTFPRQELRNSSRCSQASNGATSSPRSASGWASRWPGLRRSWGKRRKGASPPLCRPPR
jgi:hypothetical protein